MTIYNDVEKYAKTTMMTKEEAQMRCDYFLKQRKSQEEKMAQNIICPECKESSLELEYTNYEDENGEYVEAQCKNEECQYSCEDHPHAEVFESFDTVLMYALQIEKEGVVEVEKLIGSPWAEFVSNDNASLQQESII